MRNDSGVEGIRYLLAEYCHAIDDGRADAWGLLFCPDAVFRLDGLGELVGRDTVRRFVTGALESLAAHGISGINHVTYNSAIDTDGERASVTSDFTVLVPAGGAFAPIAAGRYTDVLTYQERWLFAERRISWFQNELPAAFAAALAPIFEPSRAAQEATR
jgi:hypothetical protein